MTLQPSAAQPSPPPLGWAGLDNVSCCSMLRFFVLFLFPVLPRLAAAAGEQEQAAAAAAAAAPVRQAKGKGKGKKEKKKAREAAATAAAEAATAGERVSRRSVFSAVLCFLRPAAGPAVPCCCAVPCRAVLL